MRKIIVLLCMLLTLPIGSIGYVPPKWGAGWHFDYYGDNDENQPSLAALGAGIIGGAVTTGIGCLLYHHGSKSYESKQHFNKLQSPHITL